MKYYMTKHNNNDLWQDAFDSFFRPFYVDEECAMMKTDITENDKEYLLDVEMPGFDKKDINLKFENGYLTISAKKQSEQREKRYIRQERAVSCSRSYYLGNLDEKQIKAKYENGVLVVTVPKTEPEKINHTISIE